MKSLIVFLLVGVLSISSAQDMITVSEGFFNFKWNEEKGKVLLDVTDRFDEEFIYVNSLSGGVGSNDIGLDRNQLGDTRVVKFMKSGPKVLLVEPNYRYRAISDNTLERQAVEQAFAQSVIWGFTLDDEEEGDWIDVTDFLIRDAHGVAQSLENAKQGTYKLDSDRSAVNPGRTRNFPDNSEFDAIVTFTGKPKGGYIRSVTPSSDAVTVYMHHSFVRLPDDNYEPRKYDPRSGYITMSYYDYATPIDQPLEKHYILRHRLEKKDPSAERSEAVEPIVYYLDPGCPEPIKSALIEGASWWNQAFEAAGYINAFQVKELPDGADPLDVRYNMINWVHRSTRGWSYGSSVADPRTGEIIKGHVLLGSLRVRQDYMIAQGVLSLFEEGDESTDPLVQMALARLRQLSAHEVGHTIGLTHNFASSVNNRASVMDYPHPYIELSDDGSMDLSNAYDTGIGEWDKRMIMYGYTDFPDRADEAAGLEMIIEGSIEMGLKFISDRDARPSGGGHPQAHLWDNGEDAIAEYYRLFDLRAAALYNFGENTIPNGTYMAYLEQVLVPLYLNHRYQIEAVSKLVGGVDYSYSLRGDGQPGPSAVPRENQETAARALINAMEPSNLMINRKIYDQIPPHPEGISRNRELFNTHTGLFFDPMAAAEGLVNHTLTFALQPQRLARLINQKMYDESQIGLDEYIDLLVSNILEFQTPDEQHLQLKMMVEKRLVHHLMRTCAYKNGQEQVSASTMLVLKELHDRYESMNGASLAERAHYVYMSNRIEAFLDDPEEFEEPGIIDMPPGSPIGCE